MYFKMIFDSSPLENSMYAVVVPISIMSTPLLDEDLTPMCAPTIYNQFVKLDLFFPIGSKLIERRGVNFRRLVH